MPTSNSNVPLGECVVCGQETATRCSKCAQGGVEWMFFCSRDHQRAIWNVHKRVCGSPFRWPVLNSKEKDEILELSPKPFRDRQGRTNTWLNQSHETMEGQKDFVEKLMVLHDDPHPSAYMLLCNYRYNAFRIKYALKDPAHRGLRFVAYHQLIASDPLGFLAYTHCLHCPKVEHNPEAKWYSDYEHRMLCLIGVFIFAFDQPPAEGKLDQSVVVVLNGYVDHAVKQVQNLARNVIQKSDPNMAKRILNHLPAMLNQIGAPI